MKIETMIYIYGAVCLSMIGFNILYNLILKRRELRLEKRCRKIKNRIEIQLNDIREGKSVSQKHMRYLQHSLRRISNLIAFDRVLNPLCEDRHDGIVTQYFLQIQPVILYLAVLYNHLDTMQTAYFSFFLSRYIIKRQMTIDSMQDILLGYIKKENLYCSVNALQALYAFGDAEHIITALKIQDKSKVFIHEKILTEGLLSFTGNHDELIRRLWENLALYSEHTQLAILNYIRFQSDGYQEEMFSVMQDKSKGKELRLSAIRYFGRYYYESALELLLAFASDKDPSNWEYATVSISSLARYNGGRVIGTLKQALHSSNWYIRQSAAASLEARGVDYSGLMDVIVGNDRYAREMITYRLESQRLQKVGGVL